jgi:hypothetical protein
MTLSRKPWMKKPEPVCAEVRSYTWHKIYHGTQLEVEDELWHEVMGKTFGHLLRTAPMTLHREIITSIKELLDDQA